MPSDIVYSCIEFNTYIYFATLTKLYKVIRENGVPTVTLVGDFTAAQGNNVVQERPMHISGLDLYIGNGSDLAGVDSSGAFSPSVLDLSLYNVITSITTYGDDVLLGGYTNTYDEKALF
jgi:hypothetical protein